MFPTEYFLTIRTQYVLLSSPVKVNRIQLTLRLSITYLSLDCTRKNLAHWQG